MKKMRVVIVKNTFTEFLLLIRGLKFSLSLRNVISSVLRNWFIPSSKDVGLMKHNYDNREDVVGTSTC